MLGQPTGRKVEPWSQRLPDLQRLRHFDVDGRVAVSNGTDGFSAGLLHGEELVVFRTEHGASEVLLLLTEIDAAETRRQRGLFSRRWRARVVHHSSALENRGRGECRALAAPAASRGKNKNHTSVVTTVTAGITRHSRTQWF